MSFIDGESRWQISLLPACVDDYVAADALVRIVDAFVTSLDLTELGFNRVVAAATGRPGFQPGDMLRLYIWGYLNQVRSSRHLERACVRDLEALWLMRRLAPDYRTIAAFRHDNPEAIVAASAAFVQFCREQGLVGGRIVAVDGTKMRAVASPKNIAGAERLARDIEHTEKEVAYYLDRLDIIDETVAQGSDDQPLHRETFATAIASLKRRKDRLVRRQQELEHREEKVLVFGEPEAKPMGYGRAPKMPSYNLQSVVDVESGLIVHHDVYNDANDSRTAAADPQGSSAAPGSPHRLIAARHSDRSSGRARSGRRPGAANSSAPRSPRSRTLSAIRASEVFSERLAQRRDVEHRLRQQLLELPVLIVQRLQPPRVGYLHAAIAITPVVEGRVADPVLAADVRHRNPGLMLLQHRNDLFFAEPALLHLRLLPTESNSNRGRFRGQRQSYCAKLRSETRLSMAMPVLSQNSSISIQGLPPGSRSHRRTIYCW